MNLKNEFLAVSSACLIVLFASGCDGTGSPIGKTGDSKPPAANVASPAPGNGPGTNPVTSLPVGINEPSQRAKTDQRMAELKRQAKIFAELPANATPDQLHVAINSVFNGAIQADLYRHVDYRGESVNSLIPSNSMNTYNLAFFGTFVRMFSENPGILKGKPKRGFNPIILNNMVRVLLEKAIPVAPNGVLLLPNKPGVRIAALAPDLEARESQTNMRLFAVSETRGFIQFMGPFMRPVSETVFMGPNGEAVGGRQAQNAFATYAHLTPQMRAGTLTAQAYDSSQFPIGVPGEDELGLLDCFRFLFDGDFDDAQSCFKSSGQEMLAKAIGTGKDGLISATRGGAVGAGGGAVVAGMGAGPGAVYGALTNAVTVIYNAYFKKEKLSPNALRRLQFFVETYTYSPTVKGEILPKSANGGWVVTRDGLIREARQTDGNSWMALDALGNPIQMQRSVGINAISTMDDGSGFKLLERYENPVPAPQK
jgi:hypothetical protein